MSTQPHQDPRPEVAGHRVESVIGAGATSVVWSGTDAVGRPVAIKVPREQPDAVDLMQGEIERHVLQAVRHEHLVPLRDVVGLADGRVALVFDLVRGACLTSIVATRGQLRPGETVTVLTPLCEAVAVLHQAGGTHGDASARNVMITAEGRPLLMDLGAARLAGAGSGAVHGSSGFVAPEVRSGEAPPSAASDVFSLGALAWYCLTGNGAPDTTIRLDPATIESHVGPELAHVVGACIDPDPSRRPSAAALGPLFFKAARAEPVEVVVGGDEATALTNRLRLDAALDVPPPPRPGGWRQIGSRLRRPSHAPGPTATNPTAASLPSSVHSVPRAPRPTTAANPTPFPSSVRSVPGAPGAVASDPASRLAWPDALRVSPRRLIPVALALVLCAALAGVWSLSTRTPARGLTGGPTSTSATPPATATPSVMKPGAARAGAADPTLDPTSASTRPSALLQALADRRTAALTRRDAKALAAVHRDGTASARSDEQVIDRLMSDGLTYSGLHLTVAEAALVPATPARAGYAVIRARVDVATYGVLRADGTSTTQSPARGTRLDYELVRTADGWRIASISDPRAS